MANKNNQSPAADASRTNINHANAQTRADFNQNHANIQTRADYGKILLENGIMPDHITLSEMGISRAEAQLILFARNQ